MSTESSYSRRGGKGPKIERVANRYNLSNLGDEVVDRWLGENGYEQESLRDLADRVNRRIIDAAVNNSTNLLDGEAANIYRLLTADDDDVTSGMRTEARQSLRHDGVNVEQLESDLITYQSVYNYCKDHRGVSQSSSKQHSSPESSLSYTRKLAGRLQAIMEQNLTRWIKNEILSGGSYEVDIEIWITCQRCGERRSPERLIDVGGCQCTHEPDQQDEENSINIEEDHLKN
ncbi:rod-determining factor RdfA [Haloquadratum walsbyi]|jgi:hypothetical protein|uniref:Uncharacterized protein n=1 Tax=Haloquadratum walsbyi J07HQW2 TaxID=1238425 RepID=U1MYQ2_9EURY|nr:rod-determining factor RdfA [Haloquadratum walsbyi]ERG95634.1 MAG: hypothetical protein J07HQW2_02093 [Haloquadratum walsbyi J07HQW2]